MIVSIEEKNRNDFIIVVTVAGIFHGCIGDEIFPLLFRTVREDTRVMKSCRTHRWIRFLHFPPPRFFLLFSWWYTSQRISQEARVRSTP